MSILVIGEALVDVITRPGQPTEVLPGGSPLNVAVGLCRLGLPTALLASYGDDAHGALVGGYLADNGVEVVPATVGTDPTSMARVDIGADGAATYRFDLRWNPSAIEPARPGLLAVHTGSIAAVLEPGATVVASMLTRVRDTATISYDPNVRPQLMGDPVTARRRVLATVAIADVVKASNEDLAWLYPDVDVTTMAREWLALGPSIVAITRGAGGAFALTRAGTVDVPARSTLVVDTVGAGDAFMAGLLAALADRDLLGRERTPQLRDIGLAATTEVIEFATRCAAVVVSRRGADPPTRADLNAAA